MTLMKHRTFWQRKEDVQRQWFLVNATEQTLGKIAVKIARALMGKNSPTYTPGVDCGNFVVVTNATKVHLSGQKMQKKMHRYHTGYVGGLVEHSYEEIAKKKPEKIIQLAVRRMLPKNKLGRKMFKRLKVYANGEHPHSAQSPVEITVF